MKDETQVIMEYLDNICTSIEDWQNELSKVTKSENTNKKVKALIRAKIDGLKQSQPKFYINKVYKRKGYDHYYCFVIKGNRLYFYNITHATYWKTDLSISCITHFTSEIQTKKYLHFSKFQLMCDPGNIDPLDIIPVKNKNFEITDVLNDLLAEFGKSNLYDINQYRAIDSFVDALIEKIKK